MKKLTLLEKICKPFHLKSISSRYFVYKLDCILMGLVMVKVPGRDAYKLYFSIFSLLETPLKKCLDIPIFQEPIVDEKNQELYLSESMTVEDIENTIKKCNEQFSLLPARNTVFTEFFNYLYDKTIKEPTISSNFVLKMKIYKLIYNIALIYNKKEIALSIIDLIANNISKWDDSIFQYWFGDKESYLEKLKELESSQNQLKQNLSIILKEPKISKLPNYTFVEYKKGNKLI